MDLFFWRQFFVLLAGLLTSISAGVMMAFPGVLDPAILSPNTTDIKANREQASWLAAVNAFAGIPGFLLLPIVMQVYGRKCVYICISLPMLIGWILFLFATNMTMLFAARIFQGFTLGCLIVTSIIVGEYSHPKRRGYFMVMTKVALSCGVLLCHTFSLFCSWRQIAVFTISLNALVMLSVLFWPESPAHLAMKGKFDACEKSFHWLHGHNSENKKELTDLIVAQEANFRHKKKLTKMEKFKNIVKKFAKRDFQKAFIISVLLMVLVEAFGRHFLMAYVVQIMIELVGDKSLAIYFSVGNDSLTITALIIAAVIIRFVKRRTLIFTFGSISIVLMFLICILLFFELNLGSFKMVVVFAILLFSFLTNVGVTPLAFTLFSELFPLEHRGLGTAITGVVISCVHGFILKVTPMMMKSIALSGTFLIYAIIALICLCILYFILPETKDKPLHDIEQEMRGIKRSPARLTPVLQKLNVKEEQSIT